MAQRSMSLVLTLIAGSDADAALRDIAAEIAEASSDGIDWLAGGACDIACDNPAAEAAARSAIGSLPIDVLVQPAVHRRKRLLVADMESTIIENEMLDELADFVGLRQQVSVITRRAMNGELDFTAALEARVSLLAGLPDRVLEEAACRIRLRDGARQLIATMRSAGAVT